ncbi:MAG: hypothetical protein QW751_03045 [Candidatus Aenigmatarchaeota archaeon]
MDIIAGAGLLFVKTTPPNMIFWLGALVLTKGLISVVGAAFQKYFVDWMGWVDIAVGFCLITHWSVPLLWLLMIAKGVWSLLAGLSH